MLERVWNHLITFVVVVLLIAAAPVITLAAALWMASINRIDPDEIILSAMVGPLLCSFWYMFVASITRAARAKREGVSPRTGFLWAGGRLFGGWFLSFGSAFLALFGVGRIVGALGSPRSDRQPLQPLHGRRRVKRHVLRLEGGDAIALLREDAAKCRSQQ